MRPAAHPSGRRPRRRNRRRPLPEHIVREFKDLGLGWLFENPRQIGPLFTLEAPELAARLDLDRAEPLTRSFRPHDLHRRETDLLYRVPYRIGDPAAGRFIWIIVLLENQEQPRVSLVVRVLIYMAHVWAREHRRWEREQVPENQRRLPIIVPMVFYTGVQRWAGPLQLAGLMDGLPEAPELARFVPEWQTLLVQLHAQPPERLREMGVALGYLLSVLRAEQAEPARFAQVLREATAALHGLPAEDVEEWLEVLHFLRLLLAQRRSESERAVLDPELVEGARRSKFWTRTEADMAVAERTMVQVWEEQGHTRGKEEGLVLGRAEGDVQASRRLLRRMLSARLGPVPDWLEARIVQMDAAGCEAMVDRTVRAANYAEFLTADA